MHDEGAASRLEELGPEQGGGPPDKLPWTLEVEGEWSADLEHGAALPRIGERLEFIDAGGTRLGYRVKEIVHTLQASATELPLVGDEPIGSADEPPRALRAGLPRVIVVPDAGED
jgi:hypothetical protein